MIRNEQEELTREEAFSRGVALYGQGRIAEATKLFEQLIGEVPEHFQALNALGIIALNSGDLYSALSYLSHSLKINPSFDKALNTMGLLLVQLGRLQEAEETFHRAISLNPEFADAFANLGHMMLSQRRFHDSVKCYATASQLRPDDWTIHAHYAAALENAGNNEAAEHEYRKAAGLNQSSADLCNNIGSCRAREKEYEDAESWFRRGLELQPDSVVILTNLGNVLTVTGIKHEAEECYLSAIRIAPHYILPYLELGDLYANSNRLTAAECLYREALLRDENSAAAITGLASTLQKLKKFPESEQIILKLLDNEPDNLSALNACGLIYSDMGRHGEAFNLFHKALSIEPGSQKTIANLGYSLIAAGRNHEALDILLPASSSPEVSKHILCNLGQAYSNLRDLINAELAFDKALAKDPEFHLAAINKAVVLRRIGRPFEALDLLESVERLGDRSFGLFFNKGFVLSSIARHHEAVVAYRQAISLDAEVLDAYSNMLYVLNFSSDLHCQIREIASQVYERFQRAVNQSKRSDSVISGRKVNIGYISPDFRDHSVSYFFLPLLKGHDRSCFKICCYYNNCYSDSMTAEIKSMTDVWHDISSMTDGEVADLITKDRIDILIDLAGHTADNRLGVFTMKPAQVQLTWLGYPATTGIKAIDYRLTDAIADPQGVTDGHYTEKLIRLKDAFLCYLPSDNVPKVAPAPVMLNGFITFGSFNNLAKIGDETLKLWSKVLQRVPGSKLLLKSRMFVEPQSKSFFLKQLRSVGIDSDRVTFAPYAQETSDHLGMYGLMDISLDTYPYNGTTTTFESLWMGVPVVTMAGERHAGRVGKSILSRLGRYEWIGDSPDDFINKAVSLAENTQELEKIRNTLREQLAVSTLCDYHKFAAQMEEVFRNILQVN